MPVKKAAKKTKATRRRVVDAIAEMIDAEEETPDRIAELLAQFDDGTYRLKIERLSLPPVRKWEHVGMFELGPELVEDVRKVAGGGEYKGQLHGPAGFVKGQRVTFSIAGPPKAIRNDDEPRKEAEPKNAGTLEMVATVTAIVGGFVAAITPLAKMFTDRPANSGGIDAATMMTLTSQAEAKGQAIGERLGKLEAGGKDKTDAGLQLAREFMPPILGLIERSGNGKQMPKGPETEPIEAGRQIEAGDDDDDEQKPIPAGYEWLPGIRQHYPLLRGYADQGIDPVWCADGTIALGQQDMREAITAATQRADFLEVMRGELDDLDEQWLGAYLARMVKKCKPARAR